MSHLLYLVVDLSALLVPLLFSFHPRIRFYKQWNAFFPANLLAALLFIVWDELFTLHGVWHFNPRYLTGLYVFHLPVEELLFFVCIPYSCVFTFHCLNRFYNLSWPARLEKIFFLLLPLLLLATGCVYHDRLYTVVTFISTAITCLLLRFIIKVNWAGKAVTVYIVLLIPFFIVNGILTGTGTEQPVVIYNNLENLTVRVLTIPVEDILYGFELFLINLLFYSFFQNHLTRQVQTSALLLKHTAPEHGKT